MRLLGYNINKKTTSDGAEEHPERYDYFATIKPKIDNNGNGGAELLLVDKDGLRSSIKFNEWALGSTIDVDYTWGTSALTLNITDPKGISEQVMLKVKDGYMSSHWGVSIFGASIRELIDVSKQQSWKHYRKHIEIMEATEILNNALLKVEEAKNALLKLQNELNNI